MIKFKIKGLKTILQRNLFTSTKKNPKTLEKTKLGKWGEGGKVLLFNFEQRIPYN